MLDALILGFSNAFTLVNLCFIFLGVATGLLFGVLPGVGSITALSLLIPVTFYMSPVTALAFLIGITKGGTSGGAIPAILINAPGSAENVATARDGYPLTKQGKPMKAMKMALYSSVFGDTCSDVVLILLAAPFAALALLFGPPEITAIILLAFTLIAGLAGKSLLKGLMAAALGVFLATVGLDAQDGTQRMTFGIVDLYDGISMNAMAIGLFAFSSVISQLFDHWQDLDKKLNIERHFDKALQTLHFHEFRACIKTLFRSAYIGTFVGMLPGLGVTLAAFLGYGAAKRASKTPEKFGTGHLEGIAATEAANSAVAGANLIPTIALGIPGNVAAALLIGAFIIHGITPGPFMMQQNGDLVYAIFASMLMANFAHLIVGRLGIPLWVKVTQIPKAIVLPIVTILCVVGVYIPAYSFFEVGIMFAFAGLGYIMRKTGFSIVALFIGFLLGPMLEQVLRQSMVLHDNNVLIFFTRPMALPFMLLTIFFIWRFAVRKDTPPASATTDNEEDQSKAL
ncbi:tripartite tricarboxylate transporter permease [Aliamphritea hakodatensis]|uniref:tripartite tricarboxylate transporter permease n=1 Tax=Aliamphritea hakodatensis TaxID=2895352 RepID=UPI0022FD94DA|nr:tripartite tricarboxylate transporter permease [Aliamphritea hakodatensis]